MQSLCDLVALGLEARGAGTPSNVAVMAAVLQPSRCVGWDGQLIDEAMMVVARLSIEQMAKDQGGGRAE